MIAPVNLNGEAKIVTSAIVPVLEAWTNPTDAMRSLICKRKSRSVLSMTVSGKPGITVAMKSATLTPAITTVWIAG